MTLELEQKYSLLSGDDAIVVDRRRVNYLRWPFLIAASALGFLAGSLVGPLALFQPRPGPIIYRGVPPHITEPTTTTLFETNPLFALDRNDSESDRAWKQYTSRFVEIENPESHGLPDSLALPRQKNSRMYSVAAFHQLHCLGVIRWSWQELIREGPSILDDPYPNMEAAEGEGYTIGSHTAHCVEIIRHALECYSDSTLEPLLTEDGIHQSNVLASGWGTLHTCRDFKLFTNWVDERAFSLTEPPS